MGFLDDINSLAGGFSSTYFPMMRWNQDRDLKRQQLELSSRAQDRADQLAADKLGIDKEQLQLLKAKNARESLNQTLQFQAADQLGLLPPGMTGFLGGMAPTGNASSGLAPGAPGANPNASASAGSLPVWLRNNNPGNIRVPGQAAFQQFPDMLAGTQAMSDLLGRYGQRGLNTVSGVVNRWAPAGDGNNNPQAYAASVAKQLGISPDQPFDMNDPNMRGGLMRGMIGVETGNPNNVPIETIAKVVGKDPTSFFPPAPGASSPPGKMYAAAPTGTASDASGPPPSASPQTQQILSTPQGRTIFDKVRAMSPEQQSMYVGQLQFALPDLGKAIKEALTFETPGVADSRKFENEKRLKTWELENDPKNPVNLAKSTLARQGIAFDPSNPDHQNLVKDWAQRISSNSVNVNIPPEQEASAKEQAKIFNDARTQINKDAETAIKTLATLKYAEPLIDSSGSLADIKKRVGGLAQALGMSGKFDSIISEANDIYTLQALSAKMLLPIVQSTTAFHQNFSDADAKRIEMMNMSPQNLPEANRRLMEIARQESNLALEKQKHFKGLKDYADYESRITDWNQAQADRIGRTATPKPTAAPPDGSLVRGPDNKTYRVQGGQLVPEE